MIRNMSRPSAVTPQHSNTGKNRHRTLKVTSENTLCRHSDGRIISGSDGSLAESVTSIEKNFFFGPRSSHRSDSCVVKSTFGAMPDWMTVYGMENQQRARSIPHFLAGGNYGYPHAVYEAAADIFERLAERKSVGECLIQYPPVKANSVPPTFSSQRMKRQSYELAYETLKYQELLEEILADSGYFFSYPAAEDTSALIMVVLFDFQNRKWTPRCRIIGEDIIKHVSEVENSIFDHRVRLAASLARCRVKHQSLSIDYVLPENVRQQEKCASSLPQYAWVNTLKSSTDGVIHVLEENHYAEFVDNRVLIPKKGKFYRKDFHCDDVLLFPGDQKEALKCLDLVEDGKLVLQDKTSSLAARSVGALLTEDDECDLIHTDVGSGLTTAHLAIILSKMTQKRMDAKDLMYGRASNHALAGLTHASTQPSGADMEHHPTVFAFGIRSEAHMAQMTQYMDHMGLSNVKLIAGRFEDIDPKRDSRFDNVKAILVTPQCTRTAVANPIEFMLNEGDKETYDMLKDLSHGERHKKATEAGLMHTEKLKAALKFPKTQAVVYITRSIHGHENELVVNSAIKWHRDNGEGTHPFKVCPPTLPLLSNDIKENEKSSQSKAKRGKSITPLAHNFLRMRQTSQMNGCFVAVLSREIDKTDPTEAKDILRRAALQGLIAPLDKKPTPMSQPKVIKEENKQDEGLLEKPAKQKYKIGFGKKTKAPISNQSPSHHAKLATAKPTSVLKSVQAVDVHKILDPYESKSKEPVPLPRSPANKTNRPRGEN